MQHPNGELRMPSFPVRFDGAPTPVKPSPLLGEHTAEVFGEWLDMHGHRWREGCESDAEEPNPVAMFAPSTDPGHADRDLSTLCRA